MAASQPLPEPPVAPQVDMDEILSSIRSGVEEESAKVGETADLIDAAAAAEGEGAPAEDAAVAAPDEDVLELSDAEMVAEPTNPVEPVIDLAAFAASGATQLVAPPPEVLLTEEPAPKVDATALAEELLKEGVPAAPESPPAETPAEPAAEDDFDKLLAEMSSQKEQKTAEVEQNKQELLAAEEPLGDVAALAAEMAESVPEDPEPVAEEPQADLPAISATAASTPRFELGLVDVGQGPQVAFPAELLAMALRPMVQDWLTANLPGIVDKLVKEEISKMTQG